MSFPLPCLRKQCEDDYDIGDLLGRGTYTSVYRGVERATGAGCAVKIVDRYRCDRLKKTKDLYMEKHCLRRTNHPNIIKMLSWFSNTLWVHVILELCDGGELWEVVKTVGCSDACCRFYMGQVLNAVTYLRQARIVHRDIKGENVLLTNENVVKLIDFGTAKDLENPHIKGAGNASRNKVFEDYVGTPQFMPHEVIENKCTDVRSDIWSLGCLLYQVIVGCPPFHAASEYLIFTRIMDMDLQIPPGVNPDAQNLITRMLVKDANARLGAGTIQDVKDHPYFAGIDCETMYRKPKPFPTLAEVCLQKIGKGMPDYKKELASWDGREKLRPELLDVIKRMEMSQKWQDDVLPPEEDR